MYNGENEETLTRAVYDDYDVSLENDEVTPEGFFSPFTFLCFAIVLLLFGLLTLFSASYDVSLRMGGKFYSLFLNEALAMLSGLVISIPLFFIPVKVYRKSYFFLYPLYAALSVLSYFYPSFIDLNAVALLGNLTIAVLLSDILSSLSESENKGLRLIILAFLVSIVLLSETYLYGEGWFFVSFAVVVSALSAASVKKSYILFYSIFLIVFFVIMTLLSPELLENDSVYLFGGSKGNSLSLSSYAIREGELLGVGLGNGLYKLGLIDDIEGMYIYASLCEETGIIGVLIILFSLSIILIIGIRTSNRAYKKDDMFSSVFSLSLTVLFVFSYFVNILYVSGLFPFGDGVELFLFSYNPILEGICVIILSLLYKFIFLIGRDRK